MFTPYTNGCQGRRFGFRPPIAQISGAFVSDRK
jgi:hypothetical protein